jgi:hypothetical protein
LTVFAKGNLDVRDSLHALRTAGQVQWNGINEILRDGYPGTLVRLRHETWTRSDALLEATGAVPAELAARRLPLGAFSAEAQFSRAIFETDADAFVLSIQPDLGNQLLRHRRDGYLFNPHDWRSWSPADRQWLRAAFVEAERLDVAGSMANLARIVERLRARRPAAPVLIYNISAVVPGDLIHCHAGMGEVLSTRIRRFNLALAELSQETGVSIVDVDAILARAGAERLKIDAFHLTAEACRLVATEVARVLHDLGCLAPAEAGA